MIIQNLQQKLRKLSVYVVMYNETILAPLEIKVKENNKLKVNSRLLFQK